MNTDGTAKKSASELIGAISLEGKDSESQSDSVDDLFKDLDENNKNLKDMTEKTNENPASSKS